MADFVQPDSDSHETFAYSLTSVVLLGTILIWFAKFFFGVAWYRCKLQTNEIKHT